MPRFFLESIDEKDIRITGADAHHIGYALRMRVGEHLTVCANNTDYDCIIQQITKDTIFLEAQSSRLCAAEPSVFVTLYQAVPKSGKLEEIIQKSIELGVSRIVPVLTARCVARPTKRHLPKTATAAKNRRSSCQTIWSGQHSGNFLPIQRDRSTGRIENSRLWYLFI